MSSASGGMRMLLASMGAQEYMGSDTAPVGRVGGRWLRLMRTSLTPVDGVRVECDGPIWVVESEPAEPPVTGASTSG